MLSFDVTIGLFAGDPEFPAPDTAWNVAALAVIILPLALRRRFPLSMLLLGTTTYLVYVVALGPAIELFGLPPVRWTGVD